MTGWRLGVAIGPEEVIEKMGLLVSTIVSCVPPFIQRAGIEAITGDQTALIKMKEEYNERRKILVNGLNSNTIDVLLISPERLSNEKFRQTILPLIASTVGLFVIDEAHCISDWGHDFRPDYRLISRVLGVIPPNVSVLATTATANNRVIADIVSQLGDDIDIIRGELVRDSLQLQNINMPNPAVRMSWLVDTIQSIEGSGIVYTLTQRDAEKLTEWFKINKIEAEAYHSGIPDNEDGSSRKEELECKLINNEIPNIINKIQTNSSNINQIAKVINSTGIVYREDIESIKNVLENELMYLTDFRSKVTDYMINKVVL